MKSPENRAPKPSAFERPIIRTTVSMVDMATQTMYSVTQRLAVYNTSIGTLAQAAVEKAGQAEPAMTTPVRSTERSPYPYDYLTKVATANTQMAATEVTPATIGTPTVATEEAREPVIDRSDADNVVDLDARRRMNEARQAINMATSQSPLMTFREGYNGYVEEAA